jgi:hypothetical protein
VTERETPRLDSRRAEDFRRELTERASAWIRDWNADAGTGGFGGALLDVAARFNAQVAERLDRAGKKLSLGLLDWLAVRGKAARPARMPVAFKLADNATDAVLARQPVQLQADIDGASVVFETESDVRLVPGALAVIVGADASADAYYLPPPGLTALGPQEPLPTQWRTKSSAVAGASFLQLDPAIGLAPGLLLEIAGSQYRVESAEDDLVKLEPTLDASVASNMVVNKVLQFAPFGGARTQQLHAVYLGDDDLFNIETAAVFEIQGAGTKLSAAQWEYFGKAEGADAAAWRPLTLAPPDQQGAERLTLNKPKGSVVPTRIGTASTRWIRARQAQVLSAPEILSSDAVSVLVNPGAAQAAEGGESAKPGAESEAEGFANTTPLAFTSAFYPLGREPKQFDAFYLASTDAFSKKGADVSIRFEMSDPTAPAFGVMREGLYANQLLAGIGGDGALHLLSVDRLTGTLSRFFNRPPSQPKASDGAPITLDPKRPYRTPLWAVNDDGTLYGSSTPSIFNPPFFALNPFYAAAAAGLSVRVRKEYPAFPSANQWFSFGSVRAPIGDKVIDGLVYLRDDADVAGSRLYALAGGQLSWHTAVVHNNNAQEWTTVVLSNAPVQQGGAPPFKLIAISAVEGFDNAGRWHGSLAAGLIAVFANPTESRVHHISSSGLCTAINDAKPVQPGTRPVAARIVNRMFVFWQVPSPPASSTVQLYAACVDAATPVVRIEDHDATLDSDGPAEIAGGLLEIVQSSGNEAAMLATGRRENQSWIVSWSPFSTPSSPFVTKVPSGVGPLGGAPSSLESLLIVPGSQSDAWTAKFDTSLRHEFTAAIKSGVIVPASLAALKPEDRVAILSAGSGAPDWKKITLLDFTSGGQRFHSLNGDFGVGSQDSQLVLFRYASAAGLPSTQVDPKTLNLSAGDTDTKADDWLLIEGPGGYLRFRQVSVLDPPNAPQTIVLKVGNNAALPSGALTYWRAERIAGRAAPYFEFLPSDPSGNWDARLLDQVSLAVAGHTPASQKAKAFAVTPSGHPLLIVFESPWTAPPGNANNTRISFDAAFGTWSRQLSENNTNPTLIWEYWNGRAWDQLTTADTTEDLRLTGRLEFKVPATLAAIDVNGKTNYWIRARLIAGDYGREIVTVVSKPDPNDPSATIQEVKRDASNFHPPLVVNMRIRYSVLAGAIPAWLLTEDGGSLRDQSDANRTEDTLIEAFVPLSVQMGRLEHRDAATVAAAPCPAECGCAGEPTDTATTTLGDMPSAPLSAVPRSVLLGFSAELSGEPINVLLLVEERQHDAFAPLIVEALVNDRFEPLTVSDHTRALGESGLLTMAFPVTPTPRELFGKTLSWIRLRPSGVSTDAKWSPVIRGAYLNAVWASATETLTREALGSSDGRPRLTVRVARPPLLANTLELRVREPLDEEERNLLLAADPASVRSAEPDLPGDWVLWRQVDDPDDCEAGDRVYALDETAGEIEFGDGIHGMIPPIGRDCVVAFRYQRTEAPSADGVPANGLAERTALQLVTPVEGVEAAFSADQAAGGAPPEPDARVLRFGNARLRHRTRALSSSDFEDLALESSPDIAQARALRKAGGLTLVVVMRGAQPVPTAAQKRELSRLLQAAASPLLGGSHAPVITGPRVIHLRLRIGLRVESLDDAGRLADAVRAALTKLLDSATGGPSGLGWPLGLLPGEDDLAFALDDIPGLAGIADIAMVSLDAQGQETPLNQPLRADELIVLAKDAFRLRFEALELDA